MIDPLTPALKETLDFIVQFIKERGVFPTYREIDRNPSAAVRKVDELIARGYLKRTQKHRARFLTVLFASDASPHWRGIATTLVAENKILRGRLHAAGLPVPPQSMDFSPLDGQGI